MKTTKLILTSAVATALLPFASLAAIDDQGMQYVTAAEGLHGSLRVNILKKEDKTATDETFGGAKESLRLWITGSGDIGNGWATTYYWEVRDGSGEPDSKKNGTIGTEAWDIGLRGPIGSVNFGKLGMVAPRLVPGGSLDTVAGGNAEHFASDPGKNGLRFESAVFNGMQFGASATALGDEFAGGDDRTEDDLFDEYSFAVKYVSPLGFQVGAGYEMDVMHDERFSTDHTAVTDVADVADYDDKTGWRFGVRYGQDNWLLGYEYRNYEGLNKFGNLGFAVNSLTTPFRFGWFTASVAANMAARTGGANQALRDYVTANNSRPAGSRANVGADFNNKIDYKVHRAGVQVKFDRITASAGYSLETQSVDVAGAIDLDRTAFAVDAAYHLGLNSLIAVGWKQVETEQWDKGLPSGTFALIALYDGATIIDRLDANNLKETTTQLYYRVDF